MPDYGFYINRKKENEPDSSERALNAALPADLPGKTPTKLPTDLPIPRHRPGEPLMYDLPEQGNNHTNHTELN